MAKPTAHFVCQACGAVTPKWAGRCETCGEWNTIIEEAVEARPGTKLGQAKTENDHAPVLCRPGRHHRAAAAHADGHCRARPGAGRWFRRRVRRAGGRRPWHRQVDAAAAGSGLSGPGRTPGAVHHRRRIRRPGPAARPPARTGRRQDGTRRRHQRARHRPGAGTRRDGRAGGDRFDPDHVARQHRVRARHGRPGPRLQLRADPPGQAARIRAGAGRPCDEGGHDGRPAGAGAHGRCRPVFRRRPRPPVPHPARREEPLRPQPTRSAYSR